MKRSAKEILSMSDKVR